MVHSQLNKYIWPITQVSFLAPVVICIIQAMTKVLNNVWESGFLCPQEHKDLLKAI